MKRILIVITALLIIFSGTIINGVAGILYFNEFNPIQKAAFLDASIDNIRSRHGVETATAYEGTLLNYIGIERLKRFFIFTALNTYTLGLSDMFAREITGLKPSEYFGDTIEIDAHFKSNKQIMESFKVINGFAQVFGGLCGIIVLLLSVLSLSNSAYKK